VVDRMTAKLTDSVIILALVCFVFFCTVLGRKPVKSGDHRVAEFRKDRAETTRKVSVKCCVSFVINSGK